jgi:hypothetical protein
MYKLLLLFAFLLSALMANAQLTGKGKLSEVEYIPYGGVNLEIYDSLVITYSNNRLHYYDPYKLNFANRSDIFNHVYPDFLSLDPIRRYDSSERNIFPYDSLTRYQWDTAGVRTLHCYLVRTYNADGSTKSIVKSLPAGSIFGPPVRQDISYLNGEISKVFNQEYLLGVWDTTQIRIVTRNSQGRPAVDSLIRKGVGGFSPLLVSYFDYNVTGQNVSRLRLNGIGDTVNRTIYTYHINGQLKTSLTENWVKFQGFSLSAFDSFTYVPGLQIYNAHYSRTAGPVLDELSASRINSNYLIDSITAYKTGSNVRRPFVSFRYTYDSVWRPTLFEHIGLDTTGTGVTLESYIRWYYELQNVGVESKLLGNSNGVTIFPNPTTGTITLQYPDLKPSTPITVNITNTTGQSVHTESFHTQGTSTQITLGREVPPGIYHISIDDHSGSPPVTTQIVKL